jgi:hypothetical protein
MNFNSLTLKQLKSLIKSYNLHYKIVNHSKLKKQDLINEITKYLVIDGDIIKPIEETISKTEKYDKPYAIHAVLINKSVPFKQAFEQAQGIIKKNKFFHRETTNKYRFRNIPKTKFIPKTYRSKKVNKDITIVFGELKPEHKHLEGSGLFDFIRRGANKVINYFKPRLDNYNNVSTKTLQMYGNIPIQNISIYRTPIMSIINSALNVLSLGRWNEARKKYGFDKLFHLALVCNIGSKNIIIEKNEVVNVSTSYKTNKDTEVYNVPLQNKNITINQLLDTARKNVGDEKFFSYNAFTNNCQFFIRYLLEGQGLYDTNVANFLFQDISKVIEELPSYVEPVARAITTTGAVLSKISGKGEKKVGGSKPLNTKLWDECKKEIEKRYKKWSAYASGALVKLYKERGGTFSGTDKPLKRWFEENWQDYAGLEYPVYRPTKRVSKETPLTVDEIPLENLTKQALVKQVIKGKKNLKPFGSK